MCETANERINQIEMETLRKQYKLVQEARGILFAYLQSIPFGKLHQPADEFNGKSVCFLLNHIVLTYLSWLNEFAFRNPLLTTDETGWQTMDDVKAFYRKADEAVYNFLSSSDNEETVITGLKERQNVKLSLSVLQLFTHTITHEFHHKGQILTMTRLLGYTPVDTDIIRT